MAGQRFKYRVFFLELFPNSGWHIHTQILIVIYGTLKLYDLHTKYYGYTSNIKSEKMINGFKKLMIRRTIKNANVLVVVKSVCIKLYYYYFTIENRWTENTTKGL